MALIDAGLVTVADVAKTKSAKGINDFANIVAIKSPVYGRMPRMQCNEGDSHVEQIISGLPKVHYTKINEATPYSKTSTEERKFTTTHVESRSGVDKRLAMRGGIGKWALNRWIQAQGHIEAMIQEAEKRFFYGTSMKEDPRAIPGLADYYNTVATTSEISKNVISLGGSTANRQTSMYLIVPGMMSVFGAYPEGTQAGLMRENYTPDPNKPINIIAETRDGETGTIKGYEEMFSMDDCIVLKDWRQVVRMANIDVSSSVIGVNTTVPYYPSTDLIAAAINATEIVESLEAGAGFWACNRTIAAVLRHQARSEVKTGGGVGYGNYQGVKDVLMLHGMPVVVTDGILNTEAVVA